jgi:hypothetical protein
MAVVMDYVGCARTVQVTPVGEREDIDRQSGTRLGIRYGGTVGCAAVRESASVDEL